MCEEDPNYVIIFFFVFGFQVLTLFTLPFMKFEYLYHRVIDYKKVKEVLTNPHYILILVICCHSGLCSAFQTRWEFWYIEKRGGDSIVTAVAGLQRRPIVAVWFLLSRPIVSRFGELRVIAFSLFIFAASFFALAFIDSAWLVILFDNFQAASYVLSFTSFVVHFSKAGSEASTAFFQGKIIAILLVSDLHRLVICTATGELCCDLIRVRFLHLKDVKDSMSCKCSGL